jgi:hypothetical protein
MAGKRKGPPKSRKRKPKKVPYRIIETDPETASKQKPQDLPPLVPVQDEDGPQAGLSQGPQPGQSYAAHQ